MSFVTDGGHVLRRLGAVVATAVVLLSGCAERGPDLLKIQYAELLARPDIETVVLTYEEIRVKVTDALTQGKFASTWTQPPDTGGGSRSCLPAYSELETEAQERSLKLWVAEGGIPDQKWEQALAAVTAVTQQYGFGAPQVVVDRPGEHEVSIRDGYGATIRFGTEKNTIFRITTGCHLTVEAHRRGTPGR